MKSKLSPTLAHAMKSTLPIIMPAHSLAKGCNVFLKDNEMRFLTQVLQDYSASVKKGDKYACKDICNALILKFFGTNWRHKETIMIDGFDVPNPMYQKKN